MEQKREQRKGTLHMPCFLLYFPGLKRKTAMASRNILTLTGLAKDSGTFSRRVMLSLPRCWVGGLMWQSKKSTGGIPAICISKDAPAQLQVAKVHLPLTFAHKAWALHTGLKLCSASQHFAFHVVISKILLIDCPCLVCREKHPFWMDFQTN